MDTNITLNPRGVGEVTHKMDGTDRDIPTLRVGPVQVVFYEFQIDPGQMSAWLADLSAHALELAAQVDELWSADPEPVEPSSYGLALVEGYRKAREAGELR